MTASAIGFAAAIGTTRTRCSALGTSALSSRRRTRSERALVQAMQGLQSARSGHSKLPPLWQLARVVPKARYQRGTRQRVKRSCVQKQVRRVDVQRPRRRCRFRPVTRRRRHQEKRQKTSSRWASIKTV
ncbi:hypothetical protein GQ600_26249 [Phytophthora cactorum]|nr:hypothetical protein GQ600_26249 [Phytophthora cactorum]